MKIVKRKEYVLKVEIYKDWADSKDFEMEIEAFNKAKEGIIKVEIEKVKILPTSFISEEVKKK
jgi:hypothetical protein